MMKKKKCKLCNNIFETNSGVQKFCNNICQNKDRNIKRRKIYILFNCVLCKKKFTQKRKDNITCSSTCSQKLWVKNNPEKNFERHSGIKAKKRIKIWLQKNKDRVRKIKRKYKDKKRKIDAKYKLNELVSNAIRLAINNKGFEKWSAILGYDIDFLMNHLEKTFENGLTWNEYLKGGYHIDHIIPQSLYTFKNKEDAEFKKCWNYRNLRIISSDENLLKFNNLDLSLVMKYEIYDLLPKNLTI